MNNKKATNYRVFFPGGDSKRGIFAIDTGKGTKRIYYDHVHIVGPCCELSAFREQNGSTERVCCLKVKGVLKHAYYKDGEELKVSRSNIVIENAMKSK